MSKTVETDEEWKIYNVKVPQRTKEMILAIGKVQGMTQLEIVNEWLEDYKQRKPDVVQRAESYLDLIQPKSK